MRISALSGAALVALGGLAAAVTITAVTSANGAPRGQLLYRHAGPPPSPTRSVRLADCAPGGGGGRSALRVGGTCHGLVTGSFECVEDDELGAFSIRRPIGRGRALYLTFLISEFEGPGEYTQDEVTAQVTGREHVPRWSSRGSHVDIILTRGGVYEIGNAVLLPEPGTPATGVITLGGKVVCA